MPKLRAGKLRHRVDIEQRAPLLDTSGQPVVSATGDPEREWAPWASNVPAEIVPISAKEFVAGQGIVGQVTARIVIRWRDGLDPTMRIRHRVGEGTAVTYDIYNIAGLLVDPSTGRDYITIPVTRGVNDG